jgi:starvation-inducible outer membrane lipoprotein
MKHFLLILVTSLVLSACASQNSAITESGSQVQVRQMQTRVYESLDKRATLRSVLATLQDLGFVIDTADYELGTITATRLQEYELRVTVTVRDRADSRLAVRANARVDDRLIDDPDTYQDFFTVLDKAIFLTRHNVD